MSGYTKGNFIEAHTDEWIKIRNGHFTSSEWNRLFVGGRSKDEYFGKGAYTYIHEKVAEIMTGQCKEIIRGVPAIDWGIYNEPYAAQAYDEITGYESKESGFYEYSKVFGGTPDREISPKIISEIKCPHVSSNFIAVCKINSGEEYKKYDQEKFAQCQGNMLVTCSEICDLIYFDPRMGFKGYDKYGQKEFDISSQVKIIRIYRDDLFINEGLERLDFATEILIENIDNIIRMQEYNRTLKIAI